MSALGKIAYYSFFRPVGFVTNFFGPWGYVENKINGWHDVRMKAAAAVLPPLPAPEGPGYTAHFLTSGPFFGLSSFAAYSLQFYSGGRVSPVFHSDGSMDASTISRFQQVFPAAQFMTGEKQRDLVARLLPAARFPALNRAWREFLLIRKIVSVHLGRSGWNLFIDSDTLFLRRPDFLLDWFRDPKNAFCMEDKADAYGYDRGLLERVAGKPLPPKVNTGLVGLQSETIDWDFLEDCARRLVEAAGINHFLEQALTAILLGRRQFEYAPPKDYFIPVRIEQCTDHEGVFHHYAGFAHNWLYRHAWRQFQAALPAG